MNDPERAGKPEYCDNHACGHDHSHDAPAKAPRNFTVEEFNAELDKVEAERDDYAEKFDKTLRAYADAENRAKRAEKDRADALKFGSARIGRDLLETADNLRRALARVGGIGEDTDKNSAEALLTEFIAGVSLTEKSLEQIFERHGIKKINAKPGDPFDANFHEAVTRVPVPGQPSDTILDVLQDGYTISERLLRPARVAVVGND